MREASPRLILEQKEAVAEMQRPFALLGMSILERLIVARKRSVPTCGKSVIAPDTQTQRKALTPLFLGLWGLCAVIKSSRSAPPGHSGLSNAPFGGFFGLFFRASSFNSRSLTSWRALNRVCAAWSFNALQVSLSCITSTIASIAASATLFSLSASFALSAVVFFLALVHSAAPSLVGLCPRASFGL